MHFTFISAELNVSEQTNLDDLPQQAQHQVRLPFFQVWCTNVHHVAANSRSRVQGQVQVFLYSTKRMLLEKMHKEEEKLPIFGKFNWPVL